MAATKTDAQTQAEQDQASGTPTTDPTAGELVTGKEADQAVTDFLATRHVPAGYAIGRTNMNAWEVRKV